MRFWLVSFVLSGVISLGLVGPLTRHAHAQSDDERARVHFEAGRSYYEQARYDDAAREWQQSFDLSGRPELLLNISQAQERALRYDDAIAAARQYLTLVPEAADKKTVEDRIVNLEELRARFERGSPAPLLPPGSLPDTAGCLRPRPGICERWSTRGEARADSRPTALPELEPTRADNPLTLTAVGRLVGGAGVYAHRTVW